jgi:hypothetical protein
MISSEQGIVSKLLEKYPEAREDSQSERIRKAPLRGQVSQDKPVMTMKLCFWEFFFCYI